MRLVKRLLKRNEVLVELPILPQMQPTQVHIPDSKEDLQWLRAYDKELNTRLKLLELDADIIGRHLPSRQSE